MSVKKETAITAKTKAIDYIGKTNAYPPVGAFTDPKVLQKFYKQLDTAILEDWATTAGLEFKPCVDSEPIHRMRVCMAILYLHFPKEPAKKKSSKYAEYTTEALVQLAIDNEVPVEICDDTRIMRMRVIMALRASKIIG